MLLPLREIPLRTHARQGQSGRPVLDLQLPGAWLGVRTPMPSILASRDTSLK